MTTLETLTMLDVLALSTEAAQAGDSATVADCSLLEEAYIASDESALPAMIDAERGEIREAALRIVRIINDAAAQTS